MNDLSNVFDYCVMRQRSDRVYTEYGALRRVALRCVIRCIRSLNIARHRRTITSRRNAVFAELTQALTFLKNVVLMSVVGVYSHALCFVSYWLSGSGVAHWSRSTKLLYAESG